MVLECMMMMVTVVIMALLANTQAFSSTIVIMDKQNQSIMSRTPARQLVDSSNSFKSITAIRNLKDVKRVVLISSSLCDSFIHNVLSAIWKNRTLLCVGKFYYQPEKQGLNQNKCCAEPTQQLQARVSEIISPSTTVPMGRVLINILHRSKWKSVIVLYDSLADHIVSELTSGPLQARLALYHVGSGDNINARLEEVYNTEEDGSKNILIIGSLLMTRGVLLSASRMDDRSTGVISLTSWIVVLPAARRHVVEDMAPRLDNVVVVSYPEIEETSSWKTLSSLLCNALEPARQNTTPSTSFQNTTAYPWNGLIHTLLYKGERRMLSLVGQFDLLWDVHLFEELFPNLKFGFNGRLLTVSTKERLLNPRTTDCFMLESLMITMPSPWGKDVLKRSQYLMEDNKCTKHDSTLLRKDISPILDTCIRKIILYLLRLLTVITGFFIVLFLLDILLTLKYALDVFAMEVDRSPALKDVRPPLMFPTLRIITVYIRDVL